SDRTASCPLRPRRLPPSARPAGLYRSRPGRGPWGAPAERTPGSAVTTAPRYDAGSGTGSPRARRATPEERAAVPTIEQVREALSTVRDPEVGRPITELDMVRDVQINDGVV